MSRRRRPCHNNPPHRLLLAHSLALTCRRLSQLSRATQQRKLTRHSTSMGQGASVSKDAVVAAAKTKLNNYLPPLGPPNAVRMRCVAPGSAGLTAMLAGPPSFARWHIGPGSRAAQRQQYEHVGGAAAAAAAAEAAVETARTAAAAASAPTQRHATDAVRADNCCSPATPARRPTRSCTLTSRSAATATRRLLDAL